MRASAALATVVLAAGCGASSEWQVDIRPEDQAKAGELVLVARDLPSGWTVEPAEDEDEPELTCTQIDYSDLTVTGEAVSPTFSSPDAAVIAFSVANVFETEQDAREAVERGSTDENVACAEETFATLDDEDDEVAFENVVVAEAPPPPGADRAFDVGLDFVVEGTRLGAAATFVVSYEGRSMVSLVVLGFGDARPPPELVAELTRTLDARAAG